MAETIDPRRTAVLAMDFQPTVLSSFDGEHPALEHAATAIGLVRERGGTVGYVRVGMHDEEFDRLPATSFFARVATPERRTALHADSPGTAVHERIAPRDGDIVVRKIRIGAFSTTDLHARLRAAGVDTLILAGLSTSGVVLSTVREATDLDYRIVVLSDACADPEPGVHEFLTERIFPRQAIVTTTADLPTLLA